MTIGITALVIQNPKQHYNQQMYCNSGTCFVQDIRFLYKLSDSYMGNSVHLRAVLQGNFFNIEDWKIKHNRFEQDNNDPLYRDTNLPQWYKDDRVRIENEFKEFIIKEIEKAKVLDSYEGSLNLYAYEGKELILPLKINGNLTIDFDYNSYSKVILPEEINGNLFLERLETIENLVLPKKLNGLLQILHLNYELESSRNLVLPEGCKEFITWKTINDKYKKETVIK